MSASGPPWPCAYLTNGQPGLNHSSTTVLPRNARSSTLFPCRSVSAKSGAVLFTSATAGAGSSGMAISPAGAAGASAAGASAAGLAGSAGAAAGSAGGGDDGADLEPQAAARAAASSQPERSALLDVMQCL